jgi:alkanesulfonate monooxygenase SsuD/methylene tetrahydromethanopterin reductase-like flavin-dependent oxidoreductase (luciferase family)
MKLGLSLGYQTAWSTPAHHLALAQEADRLGFSVVWAAEAYGSDAPTILSWIAGQTSRIDVGTGIMQIPARTPTMTAMTAATIDASPAGGSGSGWACPARRSPRAGTGCASTSRWPAPGVRVDRALGAGRQTVASTGSSTAAAAGRSRQGAQARLPSPATDIPIYLAAVGPKNLELAGEIADGWLAVFFSPEHAGEHLSAVAPGPRHGGQDDGRFDVVPSVPVVVGDDVAMCAELVRWYAALYLGGMGSREKNFYNQLATRMGFGDAAREVQDLYLAKRQRDAAAAVPLEFIDATALLGPVDRIADKLKTYAAAGVTTLSLSLFAADAESAITTLRTVADAFDRAGVGE